jgi:hypothetical protein
MTSIRTRRPPGSPALGLLLAASLAFASTSPDARPYRSYDAKPPRSSETRSTRSRAEPTSAAPAEHRSRSRGSNHDGNEHRSRAEVNAFKRQSPCPSTGKPSGRCPGYIVDHVRPLCAGGPDNPTNMQWQTVSDAKAKDRLERQECSHRK